ncbi:MAG: hypothetical protein PHX21_13120 [bacterium]|nr:hypothetical protein [bacterium]
MKVDELISKLQGIPQDNRKYDVLAFNNESGGSVIASVYIDETGQVILDCN